MCSSDLYERMLAMIIETQPTLRDMLPYLPENQKEQIYAQLLETIALERIIMRAVEESGIRDREEYKKNARRVHESVDRDLAINAFQNELLKEVALSDEDMRNFYDANRSTDALFQRPPFVTTMGGVKAEAFEVKSQKIARELADKARSSGFSAVARELKKKVEDYGLVTQQSMIDRDIKEAIFKVTSFPKIEIVRASNGKYFVVSVKSKQETVYADFDAVKDAVKQVMTGKKFNELYQNRIAELKDKYQVVLHKEYLEKRKPKKSEEAVVLGEQAGEEHKEQEPESGQKNI